jgi:hypothetical protein
MRGNPLIPNGLIMDFPLVNLGRLLPLFISIGINGELKKKALLNQTMNANFAHIQESV